MKKTILNLATIAMVAVIFTTAASCKKAEEPKPAAPAPTITTYEVKFIVQLNGPQINNAVTLPDYDYSHYMTQTNVLSGYSHTITAKTGDYVSITGSNYSTGYNSIYLQILLNNTSYAATTSTNNNISGTSSHCTAELILP